MGAWQRYPSSSKIIEALDERLVPRMEILLTCIGGKTQPNCSFWNIKKIQGVYFYSLRASAQKNPDQMLWSAYLWNHHKVAQDLWPDRTQHKKSATQSAKKILVARPRLKLPFELPEFGCVSFPFSKLSLFTQQKRAFGLPDWRTTTSALQRTSVVKSVATLTGLSLNKVYWQATSSASRRSQSQDWSALGWAMIEGAKANFCFFGFYFD